MGKKPLISNAYIHETAILIGDVEVNSLASIWPYAVLRADGDKIKVGEESNIQDGSVIHSDPGFPTIIGKKVTIGHRAIIHGSKIKGPAIIGMGSILLNGTEIGEYSIIGAGAVVLEGTKIPERSLVVGVPAKVVRRIKDEEVKIIERNAEEYINLAKIKLKNFISNI